MVLSLRKEIAAALERQSMDLREISKMFRIREKEALDHLSHIARSARPKRLTMEPSACLKCGFAFKKRERLSTPGHCPICRSESITPPRYRIE
jgi:transcriptional regulator